MTDVNPEEPFHGYLGMLNVTQDTRPDLTDVSLTTRDIDPYTGGSSFIKEGARVQGGGGYSPEGGHLGTSLA